MVITAVIGFAVHQVVREWDEVSATLRHLAWPHLVLAMVAVSDGVLLGRLVWRAALAALGTRVAVPDAAKIYLVGRRDPLPQRLAGGAIARASGLSLRVHLLSGLHLFVLVDALQDPWPTNPGAGARAVCRCHGGGDDRRPGRLRAAVGHRGT